MTPKAYALCQLPLSLCADVAPPSEKKLHFFFLGEGEGGFCTQTTPSYLINFKLDGHFLNWQLGDVSQRCPSQRQLKYIILSSWCVLLKVGPTWGRKIVKGYMASCGITAGDKRIGKAFFFNCLSSVPSPEKYQHCQANQSLSLPCWLFWSQIAHGPKWKTGNVWINWSQCMWWL